MALLLALALIVLSCCLKRSVPEISALSLTERGRLEELANRFEDSDDKQTLIRLLNDKHTKVNLLFKSFNRVEASHQQANVSQDQEMSQLSVN